MGGRSSAPRRITIDEDELSGVMRVSESVARRLVGQPEPVAKRRERQRDVMSAEDPGQMRQMEDYYLKRIDTLEKQNQEGFEVNKEKLAKTVQEMEQKFLKTTAPPICQDLQAAVLQCYQANPKQSLLCSAQVLAFNECVQKQREKVITKRG